MCQGFENMPKFISIIDFYSKNVDGMLEKQNYHLLPLKIAESLGYDTELWILNPQHPNATTPPRHFKVKYFNSSLKYLLTLLQNDDAIIYANARIWKTLITCFFGKKTIFMNHTTEIPLRLGDRGILRMFLPQFDIVRAVNQNEKDNLIKMGVKSHQIKIIPHSIDTEFWKNGEQKKEDLVITVANVRDMKNILVIKKACQKANLRLVIVGENMSNLDVEVMGYKKPEEIRKLLHKAKVYVNSSSSEGMCISVYEAIASGLPLCLSNISTFQHLNALFHEPEDSDALCENIKKQIENPLDSTRGILNLEYDKIVSQMKEMMTL